VYDEYGKGNTKTKKKKKKEFLKCAGGKDG
jgi:hypothetical protein